MRKIFLLTVMSVCCGVSLWAQEKCEASVSADFVNQYVWRGQELGQVSVQPTLELGYKGFSLSAWGNVGVSDPDDTKELDLTASYSLGNFTVGVTDYWTNDSEPRYFLYDSHRTSHVFEAFAGYDFGVAAINWYTNFAGADGVDKHGDRAYSSYLELTAPFSFAGLEWNAELGMVPYATSYYDTDGFAVTHASLRATKEIVVTDKFSIPLFASIVANPRAQKAYFVFGFTLRP